MDPDGKKWEYTATIGTLRLGHPIWVDIQWACGHDACMGLVKDEEYDGFLRSFKLIESLPCPECDKGSGI